MFDFRQKVRESLVKREYYIQEDNYEIYPDDALQFCFVCMMAGISDIDVLKDWYQVIDSLKKISGEYNELANKLVEFFLQVSNAKLNAHITNIVHIFPYKFFYFDS